MIRDRSLGLVTAFSVIMLLSCGGETEMKDGPEKLGSQPPVTVDSVDKSVDTKYDLLISNIPIPFDILNKLFNSGVPYSSDFPNFTSNVSKYSESNYKALNLGIYGADLTYLITFEQFNELSPYLKTSKKLADELGIPLAFDKEALEKYDQYRQNKDSMEQMLYRSLNEVDRTLRSNQRIGMAALVVTGGWTEGLYLTTQTLGNRPPEGNNKLLYRIIWQQHIYLDNIVELLEEFKDDKFFGQLQNELKEIKKVYDNLAYKGEVSSSEVAAITSLVTDLRTRIVTNN